MEFIDFQFHFNTKLKLDDNGYLNFEINNVNIDFGESMMIHENKFLQFMMY